MELTLTPIQTICGRHGEVFKPQWPTGFEHFTRLAMQALLLQDGFQEELERFGDENDVMDTVEAFSQITKAKPICCRLTSDNLLAVYREVNTHQGVWENGTCALCGQWAPGCEYRRAPPTPRSKAPAGTWRHVCLGCVAKPRPQGKGGLYA